ncbi:hypothetical protein [Streptomyces bauhiniae]
MASVRTLDSQLEEEWFPAVHDAVQKTRSSMDSAPGRAEGVDILDQWEMLMRSTDLATGTAGRNAGIAQAMHRLWSLRGARESGNLPQEIVLHTHDILGTRDLPDRAQLLAVNAAYFGAAVSNQGYTWAQLEIPQWNGGISSWDPDLASSHASAQHREVDTARWKFHNLHATLGAHNKEAYGTNNPFRVSSIDSRPMNPMAPMSPRFVLNFSQEVHECMTRSSARWAEIAAGQQAHEVDEFEWDGHQKKILGDALDEAFSKLPPEEQSAVRRWHEETEDNADVWNKTWNPPVTVSQAARNASSRRPPLMLPPNSAAYSNRHFGKPQQGPRR